MSQPPDAVRDDAFRAVGRTVVNFQKLEQLLKLAAQLGDAQGNLHSVKRDREKREERAQSLTLGQAIGAWTGYLKGDSLPPTWTPDLFDISFEKTFSIESGSESLGAHAKALRALLESRNSLVHGRLARFPFESAKACAELVAELDGINSEIIEQYEFIKKLLQEIERSERVFGEAVADFFVQK